MARTHRVHPSRPASSRRGRSLVRMSLVRLRTAAIQCSFGPFLVRPAISFQITMAWSCMVPIVRLTGCSTRSRTTTSRGAIVFSRTRTRIGEAPGRSWVSIKPFSDRLFRREKMSPCGIEHMPSSIIFSGQHWPWWFAPSDKASSTSFSSGVTPCCPQAQAVAMALTTGNPGRNDPMCRRVSWRTSRPRGVPRWLQRSCRSPAPGCRRNHHM